LTRDTSATSRPISGCQTCITELATQQIGFGYTTGQKK
jgi:hypothetical protein